MEQIKYDFIIIGAGAAGLTAAMYAARASLSTLIIESSGIFGGQMLNILDLENYPGFFPAKNGDELSRIMEEQAKAFGAVFTSAVVRSVSKNENTFTVSCESRDFYARAVLLASGGLPRKLNVPGEKEYASRGVSYCATCDGPFFRGKHVAVVGGGNSACDEALYLSTLASRVTLIHRRDTFRADPLAVSRVRQEKKISILFNTVVKEILGAHNSGAGLADASGAQRGFDKVSRLILASPAGQSELAVDGVFIFAGFIPVTDIAPNVQKDSDGYIITNEDMQTSVDGLFCAGDARSKPLRQIITAASDGAVAAASAGKYLHTLSRGA